MNLARVGLGLIAAALFLMVFGPVRRVAQMRGWRLGHSTPVWFHRLLCLVLRVHVRPMGKPSPATSRLIVANHLSWLDIPILGSLEPMTFLAKKEVGGPFLGRQIALLQGVVFVDRQRKRDIPRVNVAMARAMEAGEPVVLFAEATTGDGNRLLPLRSSHFEAARTVGAGAVVQPVYMNFRRIGGLPISRSERPIFAWYGDTTFLPHLWGVIFSGGMVCDVHYGEPIAVDPTASRKALARQTELALRTIQTRLRTVLPASPETG